MTSKLTKAELVLRVHELERQLAERTERLDELERQLAERTQRLEEIEGERQEYLSDLQRIAAEFENFRKRSARDRKTFLSRANERFARELLPVLDDLERAREVACQHDDGTLGEGVSLVERSLRALLAKEGVEEIDTDGAFDPHVHEAMLAQPSEAAEGTVIQVLQRGYRLGDVILRPARVAIASAGGNGDQDAAPSGEEQGG